MKPGTYVRGASVAAHDDEIQRQKAAVVATASGAVRREIKTRSSALSIDSTGSSQTGRNQHLGVKRVRSSVLNGTRVTAPLPRSASGNSHLSTASHSYSHAHPIHPSGPAMDLDGTSTRLTESRGEGFAEDRTGKRPASADLVEDEDMGRSEQLAAEEHEENEDYSSSEETSDGEAQSIPQQQQQQLQQQQEDATYADDALSTGSGEDDEDYDALNFNPDPECVVTLPPEYQEEALHKVNLISARYEQDVILPSMAKAALERQAAVQSGEIPPEIAAHDDELAQMGLDPEDVRDTSMVAEYAKEIFGYMGKCEMETMANPNYMAFQNEIQWHMRATLVDWLLQVHMRYHMLPETLFIAINIIDRFLSVRVVSLAKLQLVGVIAMFIAAKYEEIVAPSVDEFVAMTEGGHSKDEIFKGERIILSTLDFKISSYCSPYSWVRKISKADDYDIQVRTLAKFLMEVTLLDHRFLRAKPSLIAAISMFLSKKMLGGQWDEGFIYYSNFCEEQLIPGANLLLEKLVDPSFGDQFVCRKYAGRKFLKASLFARDWAKRNTFGGPSPEPATANAPDASYAYTHATNGVFAAA